MAVIWNCFFAKRLRRWLGTFQKKCFYIPWLRASRCYARGAQREKLNDNDLKSSKSKREKKSSKSKRVKKSSKSKRVKSLVKVKEMSDLRKALWNNGSRKESSSVYNFCHIYSLKNQNLGSSLKVPKKKYLQNFNWKAVHTSLLKEWETEHVNISLHSN